MDSQLWTLHDIRFGPVSCPRLSVESLSIPSGVTAILGESGAGKTSLLNLLTGFEKADRGRISALNVSTHGELPVGWVPADFGLWPHLMVHEHLQVVEPNGNSVEKLIDQFDLGKVRDQKPETLSMGERARVAVARSLASRASVLVMDEPFAHVDAGRVDRYWRELRTQVKAACASLIFSSHSPHVVLREAEHVICLHQGQVVWQGSPQELYYSPPDRQLALMLGPANWIDRPGLLSESARNPEIPCCLRPEQVVLEEANSAKCSVRRSCFVGSHQETEVCLDSENECTTIYHAPGSGVLKEGMKVALKVVTTCLLLACMISSSGCRESSGTEPELRVSEPQHYLLPAEEAMLPAARGMTFAPSGDLIVLDNVGRVLRYNSEGKFERKWWMPDYEIGRPEGVCVLKDGHLAIADTHYNRVVIFDWDGNVVRMFGENGYEDGQFIYSSAVTQDDDGFLYVAEYGGNDRIQKFTSTGEYVLQFGMVGTEPGEFQRPSGLVWHDGVIYVADAINNRIQAFSEEGKFLRVVADAHSSGLYYPYDISIGPDGSLFVPEYGAGRISRFSLEGELIGRYGQEGRGEGQFWTPWGIAVSPKGKIAVADTGNRRVVELQMK